eukprot:4166871-Amphidinium_carterae.1
MLDFTWAMLLDVLHKLNCIVGTDLKSSFCCNACKLAISLSSAEIKSNLVGRCIGSRIAPSECIPTQRITGRQLQHIVQCCPPDKAVGAD